MSMRTRLRGSLVAVALTALMAGVGQASAFPTEPVTIIVPFPPGGTSDQAARPLAAALERIWDQPVVVENRPGAAAGIGMAATANARPDGHTIVLTNPAYSILPAVDAVLDRTPMVAPDQLTPLARLAGDPLVFVVQGDAPWNTFEAFVEEARKRPGELSYASSGIYGAAHVPGEMLSHAAEIDLNHVPYQGGGPSITALLGGHVDSTFGGPATLLPHIKEGSFRPLVQTGAQRIPLHPDVPTAQELGYDIEYYLWAGVFTSSNVPDDVVQQLRADIERAVKDPQYVEDMEKIGVPIQYLDGETFGEFLKREIAAIEEAVRRIGRIE